MKILDWYILKRYLVTFLFTLLILIPIAIAIDISENGFFTSNVDGYACKVGYIKKSNNCEKKQQKLPPNAYKRGDSFACVSGYYKDKNSCFLLPANGVAYYSSEGFYCTNKYRKSSTQNKCVLKPV